MGGGANKEGKRGETNWVVGGQLGQEGVIWKLGLSIINPPPPKSTTEKITTKKLCIELCYQNLVFFLPTIQAKLVGCHNISLTICIC